MDWSKNIKSGKYIFCPRIGETIKITIVEIREVKEANKKFNFNTMQEAVLPDGSKTTVWVDAGFRYEIDTTEGKIFTLNNWKILKEFNNLGVEKGDTVIMTHPEKGQYTVTLANREKVTW